MTGGELADTDLAAVPTPDSGVRLSTERLWDEPSRPRAPRLAEPGRRYTPPEQAGGRRLIEVHDYIRAELAQLRAIMAKVAAGVLAPAAARGELHAMALGAGAGPLGGYCREFCRVVLLHHRREDVDVFPGLRAFEPRLGPVIDRLTDEHTALHELVERIDRLLVAEPLDTIALHGAVDLMTDAMLSHLSYEEHELIEPLARFWG